jgi:hypothetical protein
MVMAPGVRSQLGVSSIMSNDVCQCVACGYLTEKDNVQYPELSVDQRLHLAKYNIVPLCFVGATMFEARAGTVVDSSGSIPPGSYSQDVFRDRDCSRFVLHVLGDSPKEHRMREELRMAVAANAATQEKLERRQATAFRISIAAFAMSLVMPFVAPIGVEFLKLKLGLTPATQKSATR